MRRHFCGSARQGPGGGDMARWHLAVGTGCCLGLAPSVPAQTESLPRSVETNPKLLLCLGMSATSVGVSDQTSHLPTVGSLVPEQAAVV